ncbi:hypothetical protein [Alsobacter sp. R-9]
MRTDTRRLDLLLTAAAPTIWGSTYIVTTAKPHDAGERRAALNDPVRRT